MQLIFYPLLVKLIGYRALLTVSLIGLAISVFLIPWNSFLLIKYAPSAVTSGNYINSTDIEDDFCYSNATRSVTGYTIQHHHMLVWTTVSLAISIVSITRYDCILSIISVLFLILSVGCLAELVPLFLLIIPAFLKQRAQSMESLSLWCQ